MRETVIQIEHKSKKEDVSERVFENSFIILTLLKSKRKKVLILLKSTRLCVNCLL
ncbi:Uncharacterized protein dnl_46130 [Desulfonema limicola]|uniref:Uncharacterized protein n=1 Tax=Desulfonema limicola TaxID=45656 RepID=A0A975BBK8_9BACT|nr:Uncharacterized protein dnl_46130 [Desulfonema limicola]